MTTSQGIRDLLDRLDAVRAAATPGTWRRDEAYAGYLVRDGDERQTRRVLAETLSPSPQGDADADLIAAAVNNLPKLTTAVRTMINLADMLDGSGGFGTAMAGQIHKHLAEALATEEAPR